VCLLVSSDIVMAISSVFLRVWRLGCVLTSMFVIDCVDGFTIDVPSVGMLVI
jgi:hypothetical protein